jgi:glutathione S-transferase
MPAPAPAAPVLHQFHSSHFNEKARWALDWKRVPHVRKSHLPGPHALSIRRLSGQTATPVLVLDGAVVAGSAAIVAALEARFPAPPLLPADPDLRERALGWQRTFDDEVGPAVRTALFSVMLDAPDFVCRTFSLDRGPLTRAAYRATFPLARGLMARAHETDRPERVARAFEVVERAFERVARGAGPEGHLVGDAFGVADLACAALLAPLVETGHPDMTRPGPVPDRVAELVGRYAAHEGAAWVRDRYARYRPAGAAV